MHVAPDQRRRVSVQRDLLVDGSIELLASGRPLLPLSVV